jgi:mono/diheme cytochrome c family protein
VARVLLAAIASLAVAVPGSAQQNPDLNDPKLIAAGRQLFLGKQCAHCHGEDGRGGVNLARRNLDAAGVFQSISDGRERNGIRMPSWRDVLTTDEIWQATAYVMSISGHAE